MQNLKGAQAKGDLNLGIEPRVGPREERLKLMVKADLPAKHAKNKRRGKVTILYGQGIDRFSAQQIVGMRVAALHREKNVECGLASG